MNYRNCAFTFALQSRVQQRVNDIIPTLDMVLTKHNSVDLHASIYNDITPTLDLLILTKYYTVNLHASVSLTSTLNPKTEVLNASSDLRIYS